MGTRLWPMSRGNHPKQFLNLSSPKYSLIQETVLRVRDSKKFLPPVVVCNEAHRFLAAETMLAVGIDDVTILLEPCPRNTAAAIGTAAEYVKRRYGESTLMLVLPSDHIIKKLPSFRDGVDRAISTAQKGYLVTFGIKPDSAHTGYGYIKEGKNINVRQKSYEISQFVEKPDKRTASKYVKSGDYLWNSGMFLLPVDLFLAELTKHQRKVANACKASIKNMREETDFIFLPEGDFAKSPHISVDYAVMEPTDRAAVVSLDCGWNDAGSWDALWDIATKDKRGNAVNGDAYLMGTTNSYIFSQDGPTIATLGVDNLAIIGTKDSVLIAHKDRAQDVKRLVERVRKGNEELVESYRQVYRPWGFYDSIDNGPRHQVKRIQVKPGAKLSLQMHYHRSEHWVVVSGTALVTCGDKQQILSENQSIYIPYGVSHRIENPGKVPLDIIEVQSGAYLGEDDIVRFEDVYGRDEE